MVGNLKKKTFVLQYLEDHVINQIETIGVEIKIIKS